MRTVSGRAVRLPNCVWFLRLFWKRGRNSCVIYGICVLRICGRNNFPYAPMTQQCHKQSFVDLCERRSVPLDAAMPCVVAQDGDIWTIDVDHPAYPRSSEPKQSSPAAPPSPPPAPDLTRGPSFATKIKNFAAAAVQHVAAGMPMCTDEEVTARHDICLKCEHLVDNACSQCGCPVARAVNYVSKLSWADQECPVGKWGKIVRQTPPTEGSAEGVK